MRARQYLFTINANMSAPQRDIVTRSAVKHVTANDYGKRVYYNDGIYEVEDTKEGN